MWWVKSTRGYEHTRIDSIAYADFNTSDIKDVLAVVDPDTHWPKAFEGGYVIGHEALRDYWTRQ